MEDKRQIFFTNLGLLGFDPTAMERKWRIPFNKDMFLLPNKKGFETVMYFLFNRLNSVRCREEFRDCWPVNDKKQEQQFRRVCHDWLTSITKEDSDAVFPRIVASIFMSPGGEKFIELLLYFTTYIMIKVAHSEHSLRRRDYLQHPVSTSQTQSCGLSDVMERVLHAAVVRSRTKFLAQVQQTNVIQEQWASYATELVKSHRSLTKSGREKERKLRTETQGATPHGSSLASPMSAKRRSGMMEYDYDIESVKRAQKVQKVRDLWRVLEDYTTHRTNEEEVVNSILDGALEKYKIDSSELNLRVPDILLRQCEQEIHRRGVENIYQGGKLNLTSLIHLWNLSLHLYINKLNHAGVPNFTESLPLVTSQVHTHQAHLTNIQSLRMKLEMEVLPELKESISELKTRLDSDLLKNQSPSSIKTTSLGLGLLPPTPPVSFEPLDKTPTVQFADKIKMAEDLASTPEAAAELINNISQKIRSQQNVIIQGSPLYGPKVRATIDRQTQPRAENRMPSKLPVRGAVEIEKVGSKQRTRFVPSNMTKPKTGNVKQTPSGTKTQTRRVKQTSSGTTLETVCNSGKDTATHKLISQTKPLSRVDNQGFKIPESSVRVRQGSGRGSGSMIERHDNTTHRAQTILADKIVEAVMSSPTEDNEDNMQYLEDPIASLGETGFVSKDRLNRTPPDNQTWSDTIHDSLGPLSSTKLDHSARNGHPTGQSRDPVATKLFSSDEANDDVFTIRAESDSRLVTESGTMLYKYKQQLDHVRAASPISRHPTLSISTISPQSECLSIRPGSQIISDLDDDNTTLSSSNDRTLLDKEENVAKPLNPELQDLRDTPQPTGLFSFRLSPLATPRLLDKDFAESRLSPEVEDPQLEAAHELYETMLETKTPSLPVRTRSNFLGTNQRVVMGMESQHHPLLPKVSNVQPTITKSEVELETEESIRVINFQNGSFSEFVDRSPAKEAFRSSLNTPNKSSPFKSRLGCLIDEQSPLKALKDELDRTTDDLLAQYDQVVQKIMSPTPIQKSLVSRVAGLSLGGDTGRVRTEQEVLRGGAKPKAMPLINETPTMSFLDSYMKTNPPPGKYSNMTTSDVSQSFSVKRFNLDLESDDDEPKVPPIPHRDEIHKRLTAMSVTKTLNKPRKETPPRVKRGSYEDETGILDISPISDLEFDLGIAHMNTSIDRGLSSEEVAVVDLSSFPISPYTNRLHADPHPNTTPARTHTWDDILKEDASCLVSNSLAQASPRIGQLIDL